MRPVQEPSGIVGIGAVAMIGVREAVCHFANSTRTALCCGKGYNEVPDLDSVIYGGDLEEHVHDFNKYVGLSLTEPMVLIACEGCLESAGYGMWLLGDTV